MSEMRVLNGNHDYFKQLPIIVFFHAPLKGTLKTYAKNVNTPSFVVQPEYKVRELILENPQLFLWV